MNSSISLEFTHEKRHPYEYLRHIFNFCNKPLKSRIKRLTRETIGFSKLEEMHDKVIGTFIKREYYN